MRKAILQKEMRNLSMDLVNLQDQCSHDVVFSISDHRPHKVGPIQKCYCPVCERIESIFLYHPFESTNFSHSRVLDLTDFDYTEYTDFFSIIQEEVVDHYEDYYHSSISSSLLEESMKRAIKEKGTPRKVQKLLKK